MDKDSKTIDIKLPTRWEDLDNSLSLGKKKTRFSFCSRLLTNLTQKQLQLRYLFSLIAQGYSIDEVKAFCLFRWNKITILHRYSVMRTKEFLEENLGWQFCGIIADSFNDKVFRRNH